MSKGYRVRSRPADIWLVGYIGRQTRWLIANCHWRHISCTRGGLEVFYVDDVSMCTGWLDSRISIILALWWTQPSNHLSIIFSGWPVRHAKKIILVYFCSIHQRALRVICTARPGLASAVYTTVCTIKMEMTWFVERGRCQKEKVASKIWHTYTYSLLPSSMVSSRFNYVNSFMHGIVDLLPNTLYSEKKTPTHIYFHISMNDAWI